MNAARFVQVMQQPGKTSEEDLVSLEKLSREFPFSANLFITKALARHELRDTGFEEALKDAAARTLSRRKLKSLIEGPLLPDGMWLAIPDSGNELPKVEKEAAPEKEFTADPEERPADISSPILEESEENTAAPMLPEGKNPFAFQFVKVGRTKAKPEAAREKTKPESAEKSGIKPSSSRKKETSLIDKFIETSPRISAQPIDFGDKNAEDLAARSGVLEEEIITENMALIYLKQKNYSKAFSIYQKLQLKFPEKHDYFATLLKNLETKLL